jgi:hypothetical protein
MLVPEHCPSRSRSRTTSHRLFSCPLSYFEPPAAGPVHDQSSGRELGSAASPPRLFTWKSSGLSSSSENPCVNMPRSTTPTLSLALGFRPATAAFHIGRECRLPGNVAVFRGSITRPVHSLCMLRLESRLSPRNTRFQPGTTLCWIGLGPIGLSMKGFRLCSLLHRLSPFPRLS